MLASGHARPWLRDVGMRGCLCKVCLEIIGSELLLRMSVRLQKRHVIRDCVLRLSAARYEVAQLTSLKADLTTRRLQWIRRCVGRNRWETKYTLTDCTAEEAATTASGA